MDNLRTRLVQISRKAEREGDHADRILEGDENYDGADSARIISSLCDDIEWLVDKLGDYVEE